MLTTATVRELKPRDKMYEVTCAALQAGMYYQVRVTSWREVNGKRSNIARTEDLRGVFVHGEAPPMAECTVEDTTGGDESGSGTG